MIKLIVLDLDRTLLKDDNTISQGTIDSMRKCRQAGKDIVIATSRQLKLAQAVVPDEFSVGYWICSNGAEIYKDKQLISKSYISEIIVRRIIDHCGNELSLNPFVIITENKVLANRDISRFLSSLGVDKHVEFEIADFNRIPLSRVEKIMINYSQITDRTGLNNVLTDECILTVAFGVIGEITHKYATKLKALEYILDETGNTFENVIAFGDDHGDIDIIKNAKIGVAMQNAIFEVKSVAHLITDSNNEDGVSNILKKLA